MYGLFALLSAAQPALSAPPAGACGQQNVWTGAPFEIEGTVTSLVPRGTLTVRNDDETMVILGLGPPWFWRDLGVDLPGVGDLVEVEGRTLDCGAGAENVATEITVGGETVVLRDAATGLPMWAGGRRGSYRR